MRFKLLIVVLAALLQTVHGQNVTNVSSGQKLSSGQIFSPRPSGGGGTTTQWLTPNTDGSLRSDNYVVGCSFTMNTTTSAKNLALYVQSGNTLAHNVGLWLFVNSTTFTYLGSVSVTTSGHGVGYNVVSLGTPITLTSGLTYVILQDMSTGSDNWFDEEAPTSATSVATVGFSIYSESSWATLVGNGGSVNQVTTGWSYGAPSFGY